MKQSCFKVDSQNKGLELSSCRPLDQPGFNEQAQDQNFEAGVSLQFTENSRREEHARLQYWGKRESPSCKG